MRISGFVQVMLCMYNSFVSLRKECLNGVVNMAAVCSVSKNTHCCESYERVVTEALTSGIDFREFTSPFFS